MKQTILSALSLLTLIAGITACSDRTGPQPTPQKEQAPSPEAPSHLADKPLKLFPEKHTRRWKAAEAIETATSRQDELRKKYTYMVQPNRPDPQDGRIPPLNESLDGIEGKGPLKATLDTTMGPIECILLENQAEPGVRHFVALARGKKTWWDPSSGSWSNTPFYAGTPIYRVVENQAFFAGCPSGTGQTTIGYVAGLLPPGSKPAVSDVKYPLSLILGEKRIEAGPQFAISAQLPSFDEIPLYPIGTCQGSYATIQKILARPTGEDGFPMEDLKITEVTFSR